ncbi:MAG: aldo/keto reductase, partial [Propionibacteriaceae bacterium]|nr:aldo/keto reductase [Propionibacteriaceae bacterium]
AVEAVRGSLRAFGLEYLDLYLIHWPNPRRGLFVEAWRALADLRSEGLLRSIGVCNFLPEHLDAVTAATGVPPAVNQIESHPYFPQHDLRSATVERGIVPQSWAPLGRASGMRDDPAVAAVASDLGCTPAQAVLAWHRQLGAIPVPKSTDPARQAENLASLEVELTHDQLERLSGLARAEGRVSGVDPLVYEDV